LKLSEKEAKITEEVNSFLRTKSSDLTAMTVSSRGISNSGSSCATLLTRQQPQDASSDDEMEVESISTIGTKTDFQKEIRLCGKMSLLTNQTISLLVS
jgi:hypothetical protein